MESYPAQTKGLGIKLLEKKGKDVIKDADIYELVGSGDFYNDILKNNYSVFNTVVLNTKEEYLNFAQEMDITNNLDLDKIFEESLVIISYTYISSTPKINNKDFYNINNNTFIEIDITSEYAQEDDLRFRGFIYVLDKDHISNGIVKTLSNYLIE